MRRVVWFAVLAAAALPLPVLAQVKLLHAPSEPEPRNETLGVPGPRAEPAVKEAEPAAGEAAKPGEGEDKGALIEMPDRRDAADGKAGAAPAKNAAKDPKADRRAANDKDKNKDKKAKKPAPPPPQ